MKIENQVTSLELSKKLRDLGVKQNGLFYWAYLNPGKKNTEFALHYGSQPSIKFEGKYNKYDEIYYYSAFTLSELGELLPNGFVSGINFWENPNEQASCHWYKCDDDGKPMNVGYRYQSPTDEYILAKSEVEARAKMLIHLLETKRI